MVESTEFALSYEGNLGALKLKVAEKPSLAAAKDSNERTPLHWACSGGRFEVADFLIQQMKVPLNEQDDAGWTPLMIASSAGHEEIVALLLEKNANAQILNFTGQSALHYAASKNQLSIAKLLLSSGAEVNAQDNTTGATPLHRAASKGHLKVVQLLLGNGSSVNIEDKYRNTPLHLSYEEERIDVIDFLIKHGADVNARNKESHRPVDLAPEYLKRKFQELHS